MLFKALRVVGKVAKIVSIAVDAVDPATPVKKADIQALIKNRMGVYYGNLPK